MKTGPVGELVKFTAAEVARYSALIPKNLRSPYDFGDVGSMDTIGNRPMLPPQRPNFTRPKLPSDIFNGPYKGPDDLDNYSGETPYMRWMFRKLYCSMPELMSAIDGKVNAIAGAPVAVQPEDRSQRIDREAAEFFKWTVESSEDGWDGLLRDCSIGPFVDGWGVVEPTFGGARHPKLGAATGLEYARGMDTYYLRLEIDSYRRTMGIVSLRRGLEVFDPEQVLIFTHRKWFANPFGNSDVRPVYQTCLMIEDAYRLWDVAIKLFGQPYVHGKVSQATQRGEMEKAIAFLRGANYIVTGKEDEIELLNLVGATGFDAFQKNIESKRERLFMAVRGAYLPFLEGQSGGDRRGDTKVHESASDANVDLPTQAIARTLRKGLAKKITEFNFPGAGVPLISIGGKNWDDAKTFVDMVSAAQKVAPLSAKQFYEETGLSPPEDENDVLVVQQQPQPGAPGQPEQPIQPKDNPFGESERPLGSIALPPGRGTVASVPPAPKEADAPGTVVPPFSTERAMHFADYFAADRHGRYPGDMHAEFGMSVPDFAGVTRLKRRQVVRKGVPGWVWQPDGTRDVGESVMSVQETAGDPAAIVSDLVGEMA